MVAVIGTGAIGSAVTRRLLQAGYEVRVWNRTAGRAAELLDAGAVPVQSVQEAVSSSTLTLLALKDYDAVRECLSGVELDLSTRVSRHRPRRSAPRWRPSSTVAPPRRSKSMWRRSRC